MTTEHRLRYDGPSQRLDRALAGLLPDVSRSQVQRLIAEGHVLVNGEPPGKTGMTLNAGDTVVVQIPPPAPAKAVAEPIPLNIVYEDADVLVIDKPAGMVVHPAPGHAGGTLVNAVLAHAPDLGGVGGERRPGIVHRLDKDTSGVIVVAKHDVSYRHLQQQFKARTVQKTYLALTVGHLPTPTGRIEAPIGRDTRNRQRMTVTPLKKGRAAATEYKVLEVLGPYSYVEAHPETGRTHQIRVHFQFMGTPLAGDTQYATRESRPLQPPGLTRHFLHAARLTLQLPGNEKAQTFAAPLPADLSAVLDALRR